MTPAARIKASIDLLEKIASGRVPMDAVIGDYMRFRRYIGSKDRAEIAERTYNIVRAHARLGWWLERAKAADTPRRRMIAWLALGEDADADRLFDGSKYGPDRLTGEEKTFADSLKGEKIGADRMPETIKAECPPQYEEKLRARFGAGFVPEMSALMLPASLDLRVNTWLATREKAQDDLKAAGVETDFTPYSPVGLRAKDKAFLSRTKAFSKGWVEIQDEGSQLAALICEAGPGMQVLDYCAGAGGKTLALAAAMKNKGRIVAMDLEKARLEKARPRFRKAGLHDIIEVRPLDESRKWLRRQKGTFDLVLADAPCTGTGTWRRNPDLRWRTYGPPLEELKEIQADILDKIAGTVKPGGRLVYVTCSLLPDENERQVEKFLKTHADFSPVPIPSFVPSTGKKDGYMRLTPYRHNTDGFFAAALRRS